MNIFGGKKIKASEVFVPGGNPRHTYYAREARKLEESLSEAKDNLCKLVMVTGSTKSGKTVLTTNVFPKESNVWFDGGTFSEEEDFWAAIVEQLNAFSTTTKTESSGTEVLFGGKLGIQGSLFLVKSDAEGKVEAKAVDGNQRTTTRNLGNKATAIAALRKTKSALVIDDFHYIAREKQGPIVRALKPLIFDGVPVAFIAIPHRILDVIKVEREMTGRLKSLEVPSWDQNELKKIAETGFPLLKMEVDAKLIEKFANQAIGSPHLMQEFCRELCRVIGVNETLDNSKKIQDTDADLDTIFKTVAQNTGKIMFDKLKRGPRQRADRKERTLKNGNKTDIYGVVLYALAEIKPGLEKIEYETLRAKIKDILIDEPPYAHEVSRVLEEMAKIASHDEASTPVIDWDKEERLLHVTDPFFAYYLRWGNLHH